MWAREPAGEVLGGDVGSQEGEAERKAASSRALSWLPFDEIQGPEGEARGQWGAAGLRATASSRKRRGD